MENVMHVVQCNILKMLENNVWNVGLYFNDRNDMRWVFFTAMEIFLLDPNCKALYHAQNVGQSLEWSLCIVINDHWFW